MGSSSRKKLDADHCQGFKTCFFLQSGVKGQSLRVQRAQEDDSDGPVYSDVDDAPTPPPHRKVLGPTASLPAYRGDDSFYGEKTSRASYFHEVQSIFNNISRFCFSVCL